MSACALMPHTAPIWQVPRIPKIFTLLFPLGMILIGWGLTDYSPLKAENQLGVETTTLTRQGTTSVSTRIVTRKVHGRLVHVHDKVYVHVPLVIVHVDHRIIKVPAHRLPLRSAAAVVANPLVTVTAYVPTTVVVPGEQVTVTSTVTSTEVSVSTITVTLPLNTTGPGPDS